MDFSKLQKLESKELYNNLSNKFLLYSEEDNPKSMDTTANLIDKLCIVNSKMFFNQSILYEVRKMTPEEFESKYRDNMSELHAILKRCTDLNVQRARLMDEIDQKLISALKGTINLEELSAPQHKTY